MKPFTATKKPVAIEAMLWNGKDQTDMFEFLEGHRNATSFGKNFSIDFYGVDTCSVGQLTIKTLEGDMLASVGDYIIKGVKGEFYPCKPEIFKLTYDF